MIALDTSVVVAGFASWHAGHRSAIKILESGPRLPAHAALESFSVLTRLPPPHRAPAKIAVAFLEARFPGPLLTLPADAHRHLIREVVEAGLVGGAVYDALVAGTARHAGATLLSRDVRAVSVYDALGVAYELVG